MGPRIAFAISDDLFHWRRLGLATFSDRSQAGVSKNPKSGTLTPPPASIKQRNFEGRPCGHKIKTTLSLAIRNAFGLVSLWVMVPRVGNDARFPLPNTYAAPDFLPV